MAAKRATKKVSKKVDQVRPVEALTIDAMSTLEHHPFYID
jgi:hypothetical protein